MPSLYLMLGLGPYPVPLPAPVSLVSVAAHLSLYGCVFCLPIVWSSPLIPVPSCLTLCTRPVSARIGFSDSPRPFSSVDLQTSPLQLRNALRVPVSLLRLSS